MLACSDDVEARHAAFAFFGVAHHGIPGQDPRQALTEQQRPDKLQVYKPS